MAFNAVRSVQKIQISMASAATSGTATIKAVTTANCMILVQGNKSNANSASAFAVAEAIVTLTDSTTVTATRGIGTSFTCVVNATIIEFWPAYVNSIQTGSIAISAGGTSNTATITTVGANAFVILTGISNAAASSTYSQGAATIALTNTTTVTAATIPTVGLALTVGYMVVDLTSAVIASVQAMSHTVATTATSYTDTITSVTQGNTWIAYGGVLAAASTTNAVVAHTIVLSNATTVTMQRGTNTATSRTINYTVVAFQTGVLASSVQRNTIAIASTNSATATITSVNTNYALVNWLGYKIGSSSNPNATSASAVLTDNVTVTAAVTGSTPVTETVSFEALEFTPSPINFKPKPAGKLGINDSDPFGKAVMWAALPGSEDRELRTGARGTFVGTGVTEVMTPFGPAVAVASAGANGIKYANSVSYMAARIGTNFSIVAIGKVLATSASNGKIFCSPSNDTVWTNPFNDLNMQVSAAPGTTGSAMAMDWSTGTTANSLQFPASTSGIVSPTDYHVWAVTWDGTTERSYQDGVLLGSWSMTNAGVAAPKPVFALDLAYLFLTSVNHSTESIAGTLGGVYILDGTLSAQDVSTLAVDPWRPFTGASILPVPIEYLAVGPAGSVTTNVNLTGVSSSQSVGSVASTISPTTTGVSAGITAGSVSKTVSPATLTGVSSGVAVGTSTPTINPTFTGVSAAQAVGTLAFQFSTNVNLTGTSAGTSTGSVTPTVKPTVTGVSSTQAVGSLTFQISANTNLTGVSSTQSVGSATPTINPTFTGVSAGTAVGSSTPTIKPTITGVSSTQAVGTLTFQISTNVNLTGASAGTSAGSATPTISPSSTGVSSTTSTGSSVPTILPTLSGVSAGPAVGSVSVVVGQLVTLTGVSAGTNTGTLTFQISTNLTLSGVSSGTAVGSLRIDKTVTIPGLAPSGGIGIPGVVQDRVVTFLGLAPSFGIGQPIITQSAPPTSGTYAFDMVYADIILQAYAMSGHGADSLHTQDMQIGLNQINLILSDWMNEITMSTMTDLQFVPLAQGQQSFSCPVGTDDILAMTLNRGDTDFIMTRISNYEYVEIANKTAQGLPFQYYVLRSPYNVTVKIWQTSNLTTDVIKYYRKKNLQDAIAYNDITGLRPRWVYALICELSVFVSKLRKSPPGLVTLCERRAQQSFTNACAGEAETADLVVTGIA